LVISFLLRLGLFVAAKAYKAHDQTETINIATTLAYRGAFADAYGKGMGSTAHAAPLYPMLLSLVFRLAGVREPAGPFATASGAAETGMRLLSSALASIQFALLPVFAAICGLDPRIGVAAGLAGALLPVNYWVQNTGSFEYSLSSLLFLIFSMVVLSCWTKRRFSVRRGMVAGIVTGLLLLTVPNLADVVLAAAVCGLFLFYKDRGRHYLVFAAVQLVVTALFLAPWAIRNYVALGAPIWSRSNMGLELWLSNHEGVAATFQQNEALGFGTMHPCCDESERAHMRVVGEVAYNREKQRLAVAWIRSHLSRFVALTAERAVLFWTPLMLRPWQTAACGALGLTGILGLIRFARREGGVVARYFLMVFVVLPLPLYFFQSSGRLRYPMEWMLYLMGAYWIFGWFPRKVVGSGK
jgi:hypothetical protein